VRVKKDEGREKKVRVAPGFSISSDVVEAIGGVEGSSLGLKGGIW